MKEVWKVVLLVDLDCVTRSSSVSCAAPEQLLTGTERDCVLCASRRSLVFPLAIVILRGLGLGLGSQPGPVLFPVVQSNSNRNGCVSSLPLLFLIGITESPPSWGTWLEQHASASSSTSCTSCLPRVGVQGSVSFFLEMIIYPTAGIHFKD